MPDLALSCSVGQATVSEYLKAAQAAGLKWSDVADWDDDRLWQALAPPRKACTPRKNLPEPDYAAIHRELQTHTYVTLQLLWEEYRHAHPEAYRYSRFCELYRGWLRCQEMVLRQEHRAGEKLFVDYAGASRDARRPVNRAWRKTSGEYSANIQEHESHANCRCHGGWGVRVRAPRHEPRLSLILEVQDGAVTSGTYRYRSTDRCGNHATLVEILEGCDAVLCGGIGQGAVDSLAVNSRSMTR